MKRTYISFAAAFSLLTAASAAAAQLPRSHFAIASAIAVDTTHHTVTLPLYRGTEAGKTVWYIVTDASDAAVARRFGVNFAPALGSIGDAATQRANKNADGTYAFDGAPDFSARRTFVASAAGFPPASATPGGKSDSKYSPFVRARGLRGIIDAPIVASGDGTFDVTTHANTEDRVIAIDTAKRTVTLVLARGFFNGKAVYYLSPDASNPLAATVERATYVPRLAKASPDAEIPIGVVANGPVAGDAPQGLAYLTLHTPLRSDATSANAATIGSPFNVLSIAPDLARRYSPNGYSPLWRVVVVGAPQARRLTSYSQIAPLAKEAGFAVNCPVVAYGDAAAAGY